MSAPEPSDRADRTELLRRVFGNCGWECRRILDAMERAPEIHFDRVSQIRMERWSKGRVILIGDAAASVSLLAGEGAGLALTQAYVLAGELQRAGGDHREAFRRHELRLRSYVRGKQESAKSFASACAPKTALGVWLRVKATKLFSSPLAVKVVIGRDLRNDFALPNYEM